MASSSTCPFCGGSVLSSERTCRHCGGKNPHYVDDSPRRIYHPETISELKEYCAERGMPLQRMRFFIGENYTGAKAFGIYKAGERRYVVYKNKADGSRAVRYDGPDEAAAVNEIYEKLLSECHNRGIYPDGPVTRAGSGSPRARSSSGSVLTNQGSSHPLRVVCVVLAIIGIVCLTSWIRQQVDIRRKVDEFRARAPYTYDSVHIGNRYYVYNLNTQQIEESSSVSGLSHTNDGYYRISRYVYPAQENSGGTQYKNSEESVSAAQEGAIYYRDGAYNWNVYIQSESDWLSADEPSFSLLGNALTYLGPAWDSSYAVPDYQAFPKDDGYYSDGTGYYYRASRTSSKEMGSVWFVFREDLMDWTASGCPMNLGVDSADLSFLGSSSFSSKFKAKGIPGFDVSTPYAIWRKLDGYYRQNSSVYYQDTSVQSVYYPLLKSTRTIRKQIWYACVRDAAPETSSEENLAGPEELEWVHLTEDPGTSSLVYLGEKYDPAWEESWPVTDFSKSAAGISVFRIDGYVSQKRDLYYHYKESWYVYNSDFSIWESSSTPSGDGWAETYLGDTYASARTGFSETRPSETDEWGEDWIVTDFKDSAAWRAIVAAERAEQEAARRAEQERQKKERDRWSDSYSSDYDSWDSSDTDWDSDW